MGIVIPREPHAIHFDQPVGDVISVNVRSFMRLLREAVPHRIIRVSEVFTRRVIRFYESIQWIEVIIDRDIHLPDSAWNLHDRLQAARHRAVIRPPAPELRAAQIQAERAAAGRDVVFGRLCPAAPGSVSRLAWKVRSKVLSARYAADPKLSIE